jgi:hypothetical protein
MRYRILLAMPLLLAGCSGPSDTPPPRPDSEETNVIGAPLEESLDKARSVEDLSGERLGGLDEAIEEAN